jgi:hypothetical protein
MQRLTDVSLGFLKDKCCGDYVLVSWRPRGSLDDDSLVGTTSSALTTIDGFGIVDEMDARLW